MKVSIRQMVFETNSSSVHSCSICTEDTYRKFNNGEFWYKEEEDSYLPENEAIEFNLNYIKENYTDMTEDEFAQFSEVYRREKNFDAAFDAIDWEYNKWDIDSYDIYMNDDDYWDYHEYEDWSHYFKDTAGVDMVAWGYCGHD